MNRAIPEHGSYTSLFHGQDLSALHQQNHFLSRGPASCVLALLESCFVSIPGVGMVLLLCGCLVLLSLTCCSVSQVAS